VVRKIFGGGGRILFTGFEGLLEAGEEGLPAFVELGKARSGWCIFVKESNRLGKLFYRPDLSMPKRLTAKRLLEACRQSKEGVKARKVSDANGT